MVLMWKLTTLNLRNFKVSYKCNYMIINVLSIFFKNYHMLKFLFHNSIVVILKFIF